MIPYNLDFETKNIFFSTGGTLGKKITKMACARFKVNFFGKKIVEIIFLCINVYEFDALPLRFAIWKIMGHPRNHVLMNFFLI